MNDQIRALRADIIDRIAEDAQFRDAMKDDPEQAMVLAGFATQAAAIIAQDHEAEVAGFANRGPVVLGVGLNSLAGAVRRPSPPRPTGLIGDDVGIL